MHNSRAARRLAIFLLATTLGATGCASQEPVELTILHLNDLHARLLPDDQGLGGFAEVATVLEQERGRSEAVLTLHGGDLVQGSPVSTLFEGLPVFEVANGLGIDVHCLGNHEFDYGWDKIAGFVEAAEFDVVSANTRDPEGGTLVDPYVVHEVGGIRVAVVGALLEDLLGMLGSESLGPWRAHPLVETLRPVVQEAAAEADMVIVLGHLGGGEAERILSALPEVTVVVQGHPHWAWDEAIEVDGRLAVNASGYGRDIGRLELRYDPESRRILEHEWTVIPVVAAEVEPDAEVAAEVARWEAEVSAIVDVPIGTATREIGRDDARLLLEQIMREVTGADLAHMNRGGVRDVLPAGELLARHVWNLMPFDNAVVVTEVTGAEVQALHETVLSNEPIAGYADLDPEATYRLATVDFRSGQWADRGIDLEWDATGVLLRDMIIDWIRAKGTLE